MIKAGLAICMQVPHTYISPHIHAHACKYIYICLSKVTIVVITSQRGAINLNFAPLPEICKIHSQTPGSLFTEAAVQGRVLTLVKWSINTRVMACGYGMDPQGGHTAVQPMQKYRGGALLVMVKIFKGSLTPGRRQPS